MNFFSLWKSNGEFVRFSKTIQWLRVQIIILKSKSSVSLIPKQSKNQKISGLFLYVYHKNTFKVSNQGYDD